MLKQIVIAGCTTMVSIQIIFVLDTIADGIKERSAAQTQAPGIEAGDYEGDDVKALAAKNLANIKQVTAESVDWCPDAVTKMLMSLVLAGIVIPNWTNHILPKIIEYKRLEEAEEHGGVSHHHGPKHSTGSFEAGSRESSLGDLSEPLLKQMPRGTSHRTEVADEANRELLEAYKRRNEELEANLVDVIKEIKSLQAIASEPVPASAQHR
ncbi:unnamed protein product [Prorocentrum cordatum]|uniref:Uncharacterized protein n=1 Tax=Prorocentrum cordatum TaxID=2364126 RepID=A0ABN9Q269_9DINO|nr:unnamed protein product [Polarella glacialis]